MLVEYLLHITTLTSNLEPRVNWECQEKGTCSKCCLSPFMLGCTLWKMCDNKAALSQILSHVKDKCFHHFRMALGHFCCCSAIITCERREQVPTKVFTVSLSLSLSLSPFFHSHQTKSFSVLWYNCSEPLREGRGGGGGGGGGGEFVRLMKMPFWPTYNFVQSSRVTSNLHDSGQDRRRLLHPVIQ